jgi:hypothetical protein
VAGRHIHLLSHPYFKNKIRCIKDSYVPQKQSHTKVDKSQMYHCSIYYIAEYKIYHIVSYKNDSIKQTTLSTEAPHRDTVDWLTSNLVLITVILIPVIFIIIS